MHLKPDEKVAGATLKVKLISAGEGRRGISAGEGVRVTVEAGKRRVCLEHSGRPCLAGVQNSAVSITRPLIFQVSMEWK